MHGAPGAARVGPWTIPEPSRRWPSSSRDWTDILIKRGVVGPDQLTEAKRMNGVPSKTPSSSSATPTPDDIMKAKAEQFGMDFVQLDEIQIPDSVIELVPESLAARTS